MRHPPVGGQFLLSMVSILKRRLLIPSVKALVRLPRIPLAASPIKPPFLNRTAAKADIIRARLSPPQLQAVRRAGGQS